MGRVILGAAHTLMQPGEVFKDLREADLTRKILGKTIPFLEKSGLEFKTVPLDLPLLKRIDWINDTGYKQENGDIFIEIHVNDGGKRGIENWFAGKKDEADNYSKELSESLIDFMCDKLKFDKQGAKSETEHELGSLLILNQTNTISIATELLYIDNEEDGKILRDDAKLDELAGALVDAIKDYMEKQKGKSPPKPKKKKDNPFGGSGPLPNFNPGGSGLGGMNDFNLPPLDIPSFGGLPGVGGGSGSSSKSSNVMMDRDQRKQMIIDTYKKVLDMEPKQMDLNNHLNMAISEEDLIKRLINGKDFETQKADAKEAKELREKFGKLEAELIQLKSKLNDMQSMHNQLNKLLQHKNHAIMQMQNELVKRNVTKKGEYFDPSRR